MKSNVGLISRIRHQLITCSLTPSMQCLLASDIAGRHHSGGRAPVIIIFPDTFELMPTINSHTSNIRPKFMIKEKLLSFNNQNTHTPCLYFLIVVCNEQRNRNVFLRCCIPCTLYVWNIFIRKKYVIYISCEMMTTCVNMQWWVNLFLSMPMYLGFSSFHFDKHNSEPLRVWLMEVSPCFDIWCSRQQHLSGDLNVLTNHGLQIPEISQFASGWMLVQHRYFESYLRTQLELELFKTEFHTFFLYYHAYNTK